MSTSLQRLFRSRRYQDIFPHIDIDEPGWAANNNLTEFAYFRGSFRSTTINGPVTGLEMNLGILDDFVKGRAEANSKLIRDKTWSWFSDDFLTRFAKDSALLTICCLVGDTQVSMAGGGWKQLRDIRPGDEIVSWMNGKQVVGNVTAFFPQGEDDVFEVRTDGSLVRGNARHPFKVMRENETFEWVRLCDLQVGDLIVQAVNIGTGALEDFTTEEAWALGFMFGDGWVTERRRRKLSGVDRWGNTAGHEIVVRPGDKAAARRVAHRKANLKYRRKMGMFARQNIPGLDYVTCVADKVPNWPERAIRAVKILERKFDCQFKQTKFGYWRCDKQNLGRWLHALGLGVGAKGKRVPAQIFHQAAYLRDAFLSGFAGADGCLVERGEYSVQTITVYWLMI
jgi:hypothetical protein